MGNLNLFSKWAIYLNFRSNCTFNVRFYKNTVNTCTQNRIYRKFKGQILKKGSERLFRIHSSFRKKFWFEKKSLPLRAEAFFRVIPLFFRIWRLCPKIFPNKCYQILQWNILLYSIFDAEFKSVYRIELSYLVLKIFLFK